MSKSHIVRDFLTGRMIRSFLQEKKRQVVTQVVFVKKVPSREGQGSEQEFIQCKYGAWEELDPEDHGSLSEWK